MADTATSEVTTTATVLALRGDAQLSVPDGGESRVTVGPATIGLGALRPGSAAALHRLAGEGATEDDLADTVAELDGEQAILAFRMLVRRFNAAGLLARTVRSSTGRALATLEPCGMGPPPVPPSTAPPERVALSRFALIRNDEGRVVVETPRSSWRVVLADPRVVGLLALLATPVGPVDLAGSAGVLGLGSHEVDAVVDLLQRSGALAASDSSGAPDEDTERGLVQWHPVDLLFHQRSRLGHRLAPYGGTYHLADRFDPLPAELAPAELDVTFDPVDLDAVALRDPSLTAAIESRRSVRHHDVTRPIAVGELGELLYRTMRTRHSGHDGQEEILDRPVPSGGSIHPLQVYVAVRACSGLGAGLYRYQGSGHGLVRVGGDGPELHRLLAGASLVPGEQVPPQVLLIFTARFGRVMWKYESMAYALVLKDLGVLYQSLYLVATAMGLAPCAMGGGDSAAFARAAGLDPYEEASVGEFALGSLPADGRQR